ncbi:unnamed protein product [Echinostoma caproni]|uniref:EF-hand domain-containing protein n=1 Tax=Echinostoma caproni TaxID=27848 RepID=A0A183B977_9TREM|nr:unnamed protein product [Echinostoma caproni]
MAEADLDGDGFISYEEFVQVSYNLNEHIVRFNTFTNPSVAFDNVDIEQKMSIRFLE